MIKKNYKEQETIKEKGLRQKTHDPLKGERGKKRYQQRLIEEKEAENMIRNLELDEDELMYDPVKLQLDKDGV